MQVSLIISPGKAIVEYQIPMTEFSSQEYLRYTRHIQLSSIGVNGQSKLNNSHVLIVGCGGLGAPVSLYLAAAGVGSITLIDGDVVELSNLQRQITFSEDDIGKSKAQCTQQRLQRLNSDIHITAINESLSTDNAEAFIQSADLVLDCTDNFATRYLINDICKLNNTAWIYASVYQSSGQCALFTPDQSCFRCLFPNSPQDALDCNSAGVLGVLPGLLGTLQATEALKVLAGITPAISNTLLMVETDDMHFQKIALQQDKKCFCCNNKSFTFNPLSTHYQMQCTTDETPMHSIAAADFKEWSKRDDVLLIDVRDKNENKAFNLGGEHIPLHRLSSSTAASLTTITHNKTIILYCQSGVRSQQACQLLREHNINAFSVVGGIAQIIRY
jgi:molybdopterin/thiamine biosynthesis adenylyltransferase/rhodanese-related sulfurtransferase